MSRTKACEDHLGNKYSSITEMCEHYGISTETFTSRIKIYHWTIEQALTYPANTKLNSQTYIDHKGNKFSSLSEMARYWNISQSTLQRRLKTMNLSIEDALTKSTQELKHPEIITDHLGNKFSSKAAMCEYWGIPRQVFFSRMQIGWSLEDCLSKPLGYQPKNSKQITDHIGQTFESISDMCKYWKIGRTTYNARIKSGWSIEEALTKSKKEINVTQQPCVDHLGQKFASQNEMCRHYNITRHALFSRIHTLGWPLEKALTEPLVINCKECEDFMHRKFPTAKDMAHYYGLPEYKFHHKDITINNIISCIIKYYKPGKIFSNVIIKKLIDFPYFLIEYNNQEFVWHIDKILNIYHNDNFSPLPDNQYSIADLEIKDCIEFPLYNVLYNQKPEIWDYWKIINYRKNTNFGLSANKSEKE